MSDRMEKRQRPDREVHRVSKKDQIHFVNARPSSETERLTAQRMVRAHVGKWISGQTRNRSPAEHFNQAIVDQHNQYSHGLPEVQNLQGWPDGETSAASSLWTTIEGKPGQEKECGPYLGRSPSSSILLKVVPSPQLPAEDKHAGTDSQRRVVPMVKPPSHGQRSKPDGTEDASLNYDEGSGHGEDLPVSNSPVIHQFASHKWDPFHTYPSDLPADFLHFYERYSLSVIWPYVTPNSPSGSGIAGNATWFPLSMKNRALFTSFLFTFMSHQYVLWRNNPNPDREFDPRILRAMRVVENEAIRLINQAIQDPVLATSDATLMSVMCLVHNKTASSPPSRALSNPFAAPLQHLQWIEVGASVPTNIVHVRGMMQIIMMRGGLENIDLPGLASVISLSDMITTTSYLKKPRFGWLPLEKNRRGFTLPALVGFTPLHVERSFGRFRAVGMTPNMAEAFQASRLYVNTIDMYLDGKLRNADLTLIIDQRNLIHFTILTLPSAIPGTSSSPPIFHPDTVMYEATRLAALVYSVGVILPLPAGGSPLPILVGLIQSVLQLPISPLSSSSSSSNTTPCTITSSSWSSSPAAGTLLIWVLVLGAIAAEQKPGRTWFVTALGDALRRARILSWEMLREKLKEVLWFDRACEQPGRRLWAEIELPPRGC